MIFLHSPFRAISALMVLFILCAATPARSQSVLTDPDFSGMFAPGANAQVIARDTVRGWNYVITGTDPSGNRSLINGVPVSNLSRVSDGGYVDVGWTGVVEQPVTQALVLSSGDLLVRTGFFSVAWQRLRTGPTGGFIAEPFQWTAELLQPDSAAPIARDTLGNAYAVFAQRLPSSGRRSLFRRINAADVPDAKWQINTDLIQGEISRFAVSSDGSVFIVETRSLAPLDGSIAVTLHRIGFDDPMTWSKPLDGIPALAADASGRAYLLDTRLPTPSPTGALMRLDRFGNVDPRWTPVSDAVRPGNPTVLQIVDDRVVVVAATASARPVVQVVSLVDASAQATRVLASGAAVALVGTDGTVLLRDNATLTLLSPRAAGFAERSAPFKVGSAPIIADIKRWGSGFVVGGQFEYWYSGVRYANLMRLGADLKPDPAWQPGVSGTVKALAVDRDGGVLVGGENLLESKSSLIRFAANGQLDPLWRKPFDGAVFTVTAAADGDVFAGGRFGTVDGVNRPSIARFRADGTLQADWARSAPWQSRTTPATPNWLFETDGVRKLIDAGDGGVLAMWQQGTGFGFDFGNTNISRFLRTADGPLIANSTALNVVNPESITQDAATGRLFGRVFSAGTPIVRLLPVTLERDLLWSPADATADIASFSATHVYLTNGRRLLRSASGATPDPNWTLGGVTIAGWLDAANVGDAVDGLAWRSLGTPLAIRSPAPVIGQRVVVEYFAKSVQRFFMTARDAEQRQLDALPAQFARTGMQFVAFDGTVVPPPIGPYELGFPPPPSSSAAGASPICRFYASQQSGSNTHFYGRGAECQLLNTLSGVVNEGYDFAAHTPAVGTGLCPAATPTLVYRLFNNVAAANSANHRYVVSPARVAEMKARGWVDEGVAFCASSAVDSRAFGQW